MRTEPWNFGVTRAARQESTQQVGSGITVGHTPTARTNGAAQNLFEVHGRRGADAAVVGSSSRQEIPSYLKQPTLQQQLMGKLEICGRLYSLPVKVELLYVDGAESVRTFCRGRKERDIVLVMSVTDAKAHGVPEPHASKLAERPLTLVTSAEELKRGLRGSMTDPHFAQPIRRSLTDFSSSLEKLERRQLYVDDKNQMHLDLGSSHRISDSDVSSYGITVDASKVREFAREVSNWNAGGERTLLKASSLPVDSPERLEIMSFAQQHGTHQTVSKFGLDEGDFSSLTHGVFDDVDAAVSAADGSGFKRGVDVKALLAEAETTLKSRAELWRMEVDAVMSIYNSPLGLQELPAHKLLPWLLDREPAMLRMVQAKLATYGGGQAVVYGADGDAWTGLPELHLKLLKAVAYGGGEERKAAGKLLEQLYGLGEGQDHTGTLLGPSFALALVDHASQSAEGQTEPLASTIAAFKTAGPEAFETATLSSMRPQARRAAVPTAGVFVAYGLDNLWWSKNPGVRGA